jgi:hypothetical protein
MSLNGTITSLGAVTLQVTRTAAAPRVRGREAPGAQTTFAITAGVEPIDGRQLMDVPEGRRGDEILMVYTDADLIAERATPAFGPDVLAYTGTDPDIVAMMGPGEPWTVIKVKTWPGFGETHREVQIARAPSPQGTVP